MPTEREVRDRMAHDFAALRACKAALVGSSTKHPRVVETTDDAYGGVVVPRARWTAAVKLIAEYEARVQDLGGAHAADVVIPEEKHADDEESKFALLDSLK